MTGPPTIETPNLVLRPVAPADADLRHPGSIRVLEKTGFEFERFVPELDRRRYVVHNSSG